MSQSRPIDQEQSHVLIPACFYSAYCKADWAVLQLEYLQSCLNQYVADGMRTSAEYPNGPEGIMTVRIDTDQFQVPVGLIIGDVVRNLRDALDHFTSAVVREVVGRQKDDRVRFPIAKDRIHLAGILKKHFVSTALEPITDAISVKIRPTHDENFILWALSQMSNTDKHRQISSTVSIGLTPYANFTWGEGNRAHNNMIGISPGESYTYSIPPGARLTDSAHSQRFIESRFGEGEVFQEQLVVDILYACVEEVFRALKLLTETYSELCIPKRVQPGSGE